MEYEKCYVFQLEDARPTKKRKIEPQGLQTSWRLRNKAYHGVWSQQRDRIDNALDKIHSSTVQAINSYLDDATESTQISTIPAGIILTGPGLSSSSSIGQHIVNSVSAQKRRAYVSLESGVATNLKALLKTLIQRATANSAIDDEEDDLVSTARKGPRLLNYDLQILSDYARERKVEQVVVAFQDTEAFSSGLLSELIELMSSWRDRIPFVCLFNIATSVDFLQQRLSRAAVQSLDGELFDAAPSTGEVQLVFSAITQPDTRLWIGPTLFASALERQSDYIQSIDGLVEMVQYAYMSNYYANALSVFLDPDLERKDVPSDHFAALRSTESFRIHAQSLLANKQTEVVRELLDSDDRLFNEATEQIQTGLDALLEMTVALDVIRAVQERLPGSATTPKTSLYVQAMSNKLRGSAMLRALFLAIRKSPSDITASIIEAVAASDIHEETRDQISSIGERLQQLADANSTHPLRSEDDLGSSTLRTTVVAQKVHLSKHKAELSKQDAAYTDLLRSFTDVLEAYFHDTLVNYKDLPFHEIFVYDLKSPHREVFTPRPRHAIERALASPHDYLDCECCAPEAGQEAGLSASQPATSVLYQLYLESGSLINVSDLWQAFQAVMGEKQGEEVLMALFQRGLAELRYLGLLKSTRKKADHVAKVAWKGL